MIYRMGAFLASAVLCLAGGASTAAVAGASKGEALPAAAEQSAEGLLQAANAEYQAGQFEKSARHFADCFAASPSTLECLFNCARAEQRAFLLDQAEAHFLQYLTLELSDKKGRDRARLHLQEVREAKAQLAKASRAAATTSAPVGEQQAHSRLPATGALVGAGVALIASTALLFVAHGQQSALDELTAQRQAGVVVGIGYAEYADRQRSINSKVISGDVLAGVGLLAAGLGVWLWPAAPTSTPSLPVAGVRWTGDGAVLTANFAY